MRNRVTSTTQKKSDGTVVSSETHVYDDASNMTSKTVDSVVTTYTYDDIAQLTGESRTGYVCTYTYDANGNRLTKTLDGNTENYTYDDADKMLTAGAKTYGYDAAGRTTSVTANNQTTTLAYDYEGRLTQITYPNNSTNTFTYNALDTRVGKVDSAGTKTFKRDGVGVTAPVLSDGAAAYTPGVSERRSGTSKFFHGDYLNSITRETDASQNTTATKQYDAFGMPISSTGSSASPFGFAGGFGYQEDQDSGLKLLGHRYYDPSTGRFLTRDPAKDGRNWYGYCDNNPIGSYDLSGLFSWRAFGIGVLDGLIGLGIGVAVGALIVFLAPAAILPAILIVSAAVGGWMVGKAVYEAIVGRQWAADGTGADLSDEARSGAAGRALVGVATIGISATKWFRRGAARDNGFLRLRPLDRLRYEIGEQAVADGTFRDVGHLPPQERNLTPFDWAPGNIAKLVPQGPTPAVRCASPVGLAGTNGYHEVDAVWRPWRMK